MGTKTESDGTCELSKSEIVRAHEKVKELPEEVAEELSGAYGEIYDAVNRGEFV